MRETGDGRRGTRWTWVALAVAAGLAGWVREGGAQYLAVFVDGRVLSVAAVRLLEDGALRLELPGGGRLDIPVNRLESVVDAAPETSPPPTSPPCSPRFAAQPLPDSVPFRELIDGVSRAVDLHPWLVAAVIEAESRFNPGAVSRVGARGLMQLMPSVSERFGVSDPHDPVANVTAGSRYLAELIGRFGDLALALAAYNAGPRAVERSSGVPPYRETREYVRRVLATFCPGGGSGAVVGQEATP